MHHCPLCLAALYLEPDEPHLLRCLLRFAIEARVGGYPWRRWTVSR